MHAAWYLKLSALKDEGSIEGGMCALSSLMSKDTLQMGADGVTGVCVLRKSHIAKILHQLLGSSTGWKIFPDDRHGLTTDLNSNTGRDVSDLCLTPSGVKTTRPAPLINVMLSLSLSFLCCLSLSISLSSPGQAIKWQNTLQRKSGANRLEYYNHTIISWKSQGGIIALINLWRNWGWKMFK